MAPSVEERIKTLKLRREAFKLELENFRLLLDGYESGMSVSEIKVQYNEIEAEYATFCKTQVDLDAADETGIFMRERISIKNMFGTCKARAIDILELMKAAAQSLGMVEARDAVGVEAPISRASPYSPTESMDSGIYLPKINLPVFAGAYEEWPGFSDQFRSSIQENPRINDCKKLMYLRSCLKDEAAKTIESVGNSANNYGVAWNLLEKRYNQPAIIVANHLKALFDTSPLVKSSYSELRVFVNRVEAHYRSLKSIEQPTIDTLLIHLFMSKLDTETVLKWKEQNTNTPFPTLDELFRFLHDRCKVIEPVGTPEASSSSPPQTQGNNRNKYSQSTRNKPPIRELRSNTVLATQTTPFCNFCRGSHVSQNCEQFIKLSVPERSKLVKEKQLCFNCLRRNHMVNSCQATTCRRCHNRHHTLLHAEPTPIPPAVQVNNTCAAFKGRPKIIFATAIVDIVNGSGKTHSCRVVLDSCADSHFLSERACKRIGLRTQPIVVPLRGTNAMSSEINQITQAQVKSRNTGYKFNVNFLVAKEVSQPLPQEVIYRESLEIPAGIHLADPTFHLPGEIDGIIGGEYFWDLMSVGRIALADPNAKLQKTLLGWIVVGKYLENQPIRPVNCHLTFEALHADITKFWTLEECPSGKICSPEEQACEEHYVSHTSRDFVSGRYTVSLPFNDKQDKLGETYQMAMKRFLSLERSLNRNIDTKSQYVAFLKEYEQLNHMTETVEDVNTGCYLPHHPVIKTDSVTTKIRVVFDASAHSSSGVTLNNTLMVGPTIQQDLVSLVTRFRLHKYVLTADIAKMYRQVDLNIADRKYHKILWRENVMDPIKTYQLNTVTYRTASAPFLAIRTLHQLAHDEGKAHPLAAKVLLNDFYVDDVLTGAQSFDEASLLRDDLISITKKGGFQLRQWLSNEPQLVESLGNTERSEHMVLDATDGKKTLGLFWKARQDSLGYNIKDVKPLQRITKRTILSRIAQLFDPLRLVGPVIVQAKLIMQALWKCHLDWDESVPVDIHSAWVTFESQLKSLEDLVIPRRVIADNHKILQLHGFCDASERAYGACLYIRTTDSKFNSVVRLVSSRSRVAPLKVQSLPRLELCAAVLLAKLFRAITQAINVSFEKIMFWSDSTITLHWIHAAPHTLKQFVANRVSQIQQHTCPDQWSHVPSQDNSADILSRGASVPEFLATNIWFSGPQWLSQAEDTWPQSDLQPIDIPERRRVVVLSAATHVEIQFLERHSSFSMVTRVVAYCLRFYNNTHTKLKQIGPLTLDELQQARVRILKLLQSAVFSKELHELKANSAPSRVNRFRALCPFIDSNGLLRVGGRLEKSNLPYSTKHPVLLPQNHHLTSLLIREAHIAHGHIGAQGTLHAVRQRYWPVNGLVVVKSVLRRCTTCQKLTPTTFQYPMGQLPRDRVTFQRPFLIAGVDYCGPLFIKEKKHRNTKKIKVYVAVFVCFSTRAVHIELVGDLTSDAFLAALKRFFARRGRSTDIYSDNGTNFVGANHELQRVRKMILSDEHNDHVQKFLLDQHVRWHFIPPRSPHFGGLWEAAVKSVKHHLTRILGNTLLTFEELVTCLTEIEAILNSRPLTPLSSDPNDLTPLTPGHFLIGDSLTSTPECDLTDIKPGRLSSWQHVQQLRQHFWHRWYKDYLNSLSVRKKWHGDQVPAITEGTLVILKEDNSPPLHWPMGRIIALHPGEDGVVRVVTVKTINGIYKRSVKKLAPLLLEE